MVRSSATISCAVAMTASTRPSFLGAWAVVAARGCRAAGPACGVLVVTVISSSGAGWPGARLPPGCVSGHHAADVIEAAGGMGGGAVLPGGPVRAWAAGPGGGYRVPAR